MKQIYFYQFVLIFTIATLGCGQKMQSSKSISGSELASSEATSLGELNWGPTQKTTDEDVEMVYNLKIPFGRVYKTISSTIEKITPLLQKQLSNEIQKYQIGEVPVGSIINNDWKQLIEIDVERTETVKSGYTVTVDGFTLPIWLSRSTRQGNYVENCLDYKKPMKMVSSKSFGKDISFQWSPQERSIKMEMCMNIPGATLTIPKRVIHARARKKTWYGHFSTSSDFEIMPGQVQWDYGRGCFAAEYMQTNENGAGILNFTATEKPYLKSVSYTGLNIKIKNWFLRLIDNILSVFNASIRKAVIKKVSSTVNTIADQDIESGRWFSKVYTDEVLNNLAKRVHEKIRNTVQRVGGFVENKNLRNLLLDNCRLMKYSKSPKWTAKHQVFCSEIAQSLKISIDPLYFDDKSQKEGCYNYLANVHAAKDSSGRDKWWADRCKFNVQFSIKMSQAAKDYLDELHDVIRNQIDELRIPKEWQTFLKEQNVDEYLLNLALEEAEKKGLQQLDVETYKEQLVSLIEQVKTK